MNPALLAGVDENDDEDTSLAGVQGDDTSIGGVPIPIATNNDDDNLDTESDDDNSIKASIHSTRSHAQFKT